MQVFNASGELPAMKPRTQFNGEQNKKNLALHKNNRKIYSNFFQTFFLFRFLEN